VQALQDHDTEKLALLL